MLIETKKVVIHIDGDEVKWTPEWSDRVICRAKRPVRAGQLVTSDDVEMPIDVEGHEVNRRTPSR